MQSLFDEIMTTPREARYLSPPSVLDPRKHCFCTRRIDAHGGRLTWRAIFGTPLTKIHTFYTVLLTQKITPALKTCCYINVVSWIGGESKAISKMIIISTELLPLDRVADSANLDRVMKSIFNDAMLLEVSCVSHDLMQ